MTSPVILTAGNPGHAESGIRRRLAELESQQIGRVARHGMGNPDVIPLWFGESDLPTPAFIREAAATAMAEGETRYTFNTGFPPLREAIAGYMSRLYGLPVTRDRICVTAGAMGAIMVSMELLLEPGDDVVLITPLWPNIFRTIRTMGATSRSVPLDRTDTGWKLDFDKLTAAVTDRTRAFFINTPGNPTGWMMEAEEMRALVEFARERGIWIVADEVYARLVYDRDVAPSFLQVSEPEDRIIVINSFSKSWAMTGWRLGWATVPESLCPLFGEMVQFNTTSAPTFLQRAGIAAVTRGDAFTAEMVEHCRRGRDLVTQRLAAMPRVKAVAPRAAFYHFFAVDGMEDGIDYAIRLVHEAKVGLAPGEAFGAGSDGCLRLCFASSPDRLSAAMDRLEPFLS